MLSDQQKWTYNVPKVRKLSAKLKELECVSITYLNNYQLVIYQYVEILP